MIGLRVEAIQSPDSECTQLLEIYLSLALELKVKTKPGQLVAFPNWPRTGGKKRAVGHCLFRKASCNAFKLANIGSILISGLCTIKPMR